MTTTSTTDEEKVRRFEERKAEEDALEYAIVALHRRGGDAAFSLPAEKEPLTHQKRAAAARDRYLAS